MIVSGFVDLLKVKECAMAEVSFPCAPGRQTLQDSGVNDGDEVGGEVVEKSSAFLRFRVGSSNGAKLLPLGWLLGEKA